MERQEPEGEPERVLDRDARVREDHERRRAMRPNPLDPFYSLTELREPSSASVYAVADALVWQVMNDTQETIHAWSPPCSTPIGMRYWRDVRLAHLSLPQPVRCLHPMMLDVDAGKDMMSLGLIPVIAHGQMTCTVVVARHLHLERDTEATFHGDTRKPALSCHHS